jgi:hypothetical protein
MDADETKTYLRTPMEAAMEPDFAAPSTAFA